MTEAHSLDFYNEYSVFVTELLLYSEHYKLCKMIYDKIPHNSRIEGSHLVRRCLKCRAEFQPNISRTPKNTKFYFN